jgi:hypothetical protein
MRIVIPTAVLAAFSVATPVRSQEIVPASNGQMDNLTDEQVLKALRDHLPFDIGGGFLLWNYNPLSLEGVDGKTEIYYVNLVIDGHYDDFGIHFEPRFRDTKLRPFFESNIWVQEFYMSWKPSDSSDGMLKVGKVYSQFGRFWDGVFYGNIPYFDGLKLDPDLGLSWESKLQMGDSMTVDYSAQFFDQDGETNGSLQGRDTLSVGKERDIFVGRVAPTFHVGGTTSVTAGVSGMHGEADLDSPAANSTFTRANGELALKTGSFEVFGDFTHQNGHHVEDFPVVGSSSDDIDYLMSGFSYVWGDWTFRGNYSFGDYNDDDVKEELWLPGIQWQFHKNLSLWLEYVYWSRDEAGDTDIIDRSMNIVLYGTF